MSERIVAHIDMDAFFASVEEREKPYLKGLPVIVGADPKGGKGRGVAATANYEARTLGIRSATPITKAWRLCEEARRRDGTRCVFITSRFRTYTKASREVFSVVQQFADTLVQSSVDEAYLCFAQVCTYTEARARAQALKQALHKETQLSCSIGVAPNKMLAKIASDYEKPDGLTVITPEHAEGFIAPLPVAALPGVGRRAQETFARLGIVTVHEARALSWEELSTHFGSYGFTLWERLRGIDERPLVPPPPKTHSIGKEHTFADDVRDSDTVMHMLARHITRVREQVKREGYTGFRTVVLTVRFEDFTTVTRSLTTDEPLTTQKACELKALKLLLPFFEKTHNPQGKAIRLIGFRAEKLV